MKHKNKKRDYLLPKGCKDLVDVLKAKVKQTQRPMVTTVQLPAIMGELTLADQMTVDNLAAALKKRPSQIAASLNEFGWSVRNPLIPFELVACVVRLYGFTAKLAD